MLASIVGNDKASGENRVKRTDAFGSATAGVHLTANLDRNTELADLRDAPSSMSTKQTWLTRSRSLCSTIPIRRRMVSIDPDRQVNRSNSFSMRMRALRGAMLP